MRLEQLQKKYITEGWNDPQMLLLEQKVINPFVSNVERIVLEAELTPDQIKQVFANVEKGATEAGGNRTAVGKGADAVKNTAGAIKAEIDKLGSAIKNAGPVQNMDAKFKELKTKIGEKDSKVVSAVKAVSDWAKENPGKASVAVAILTAAAALAGGPLGGLVGGFLGRATKDILQGKDLSTAIGKSAMTGAVGAAAGGAIELIGDLVDPDVSQVIIASDGQTIDVAGLEGMKATSIENLSPEAAEDLLKTQNALETAMRNVSGDEYETIAAEFDEISAKVNELGGQQALQDHAGLEGQDLERQTTTTTDVGVDKSGDATAGADGPAGDSPDAGAQDMSEVETVKAEPVSAAELKEVGINFDAEPDIKPEVKAWAESKGLDPEQVQKMFQMEKGMADARFMGTNVSASSEMASNWTGDAPTLSQTTLPDGAEIKVGEQFTSTSSTSVGGIEPPISFTSTVSVEGVDANGDPVFMIKEVSTMPSHPLWDNIDKANLSDEDFEQLLAFMDEYSGTSMSSKAGIETVIDTFKQDLAKSIGAAATAVAMGTAMQDKKVVPANAEPAQESIDYKVKRLSEGQIYMLFNRVERVNTHMLENKIMFESVFDAVSHYHRQNLNEGPFDAIKGAASKVGGALKTGAKAVGGAISGAAKQVTTKVTAEKLTSAWKKAGSPTDSAAVYDVIKGLGVADDVIKGTFDAMKIEVPAAQEEPAADAEAGAPEGGAGDEGNTSGDTTAPTDDTQAGTQTGNTSTAATMKKGEKVTFKNAKTGEEKIGYIVDPEKGPNGKTDSISVVNNPNQGANQAYPVLRTNIVSDTEQTNTDGATDTNTASTSGGQGGDTTTAPTDQVDADKDGKDDNTGEPMKPIAGAGTDRTAGAQNAQAGGAAQAPTDMNALVQSIKKLKPEVQAIIKKQLAA